MAKANDIALMSMVVGMFLALLVCIGVVGYYAYRVTDTDYRYNILKREYTELIYNAQRDNDIRYNRLQDQMYSMQYTYNKKIELLEEQLKLYRDNKN